MWIKMCHFSYLECIMHPKLPRATLWVGNHQLQRTKQTCINTYVQYTLATTYMCMVLGGWMTWENLLQTHTKNISRSLIICDIFSRLRL